MAVEEDLRMHWRDRMLGALVRWTGAIAGVTGLSADAFVPPNFDGPVQTKAHTAAAIRGWGALMRGAGKRKRK